MTKLKHVSKRRRPLLGTFVEIQIFTDADHNSIITAAFNEAAELEKIFNYHDPDSALSQLNTSPSPQLESLSPHLKKVLEKSKMICEISAGAFSPYCGNTKSLDLSGIAKGYIVDKMVEKISDSHPGVSGVVNAGGDLRYFNCETRTVDIRMGTLKNPVLRAFTLPNNAMATSALNVTENAGNSSSVYSKKLRDGLTVDHTVSVIAGNCMVADALTKVGLFANVETVEKCALEFAAQIMVFDAGGELQEIFGKHEAQ